MYIFQFVDNFDDMKPPLTVLHMVSTNVIVLKLIAIHIVSLLTVLSDTIKLSHSL